MVERTERPRRKRLSWESRCEVVAAIEAGVRPPLAAARGGCSRATAYRLWHRYREGGWAALRDRSSVPRRQPRRLAVEAEQAILAARRRSAYGPVRLAGLLPHPPSTIGKVLRRHGCSRLPRPDGAGARCARRYERERPGELLHVDTKKLGRFWEPGKRALGPMRAGRTGAEGSAGSTCTSPSTTTRDSPTPSSSPARTPSSACASSSARPPGTTRRESTSSAY
jgi:Winged helix-turn helix